MNMQHFYNIFIVVFVYSTVASAITKTNEELFENKNILIIGGTGYLGRAIAQEILKYNPKKIIIYSRDEIKHFTITKLFRDHPQIESMIGDIRDYESLLRATKGIDIVFHVAALKRMDTIESNVEEAIKTNIVGSVNVFNACVSNEVEKVLFISTDKACSPINAYGACKFVSEKVFTNYDTRKIKTKCVVTRFGNILESTGSVIPIFIDKIKNGEDIPLTNDQMTRFIICKEHAVELIFDALRYCIGGEIFVKPLPALKVTDLIEVLKEKYHANNKVKIIGLRPGEKIHEILINESEMGRTIQFEDCYIIRPSVLNLFGNDENELPVYMQPGNYKSLSFVASYGSEEAVISKARLAELFEELGIL